MLRMRSYLARSQLNSGVGPTHEPIPQDTDAAVQTGTTLGSGIVSGVFMTTQFGA